MDARGQDPAGGTPLAIDQELVDAAIALVHARFGDNEPDAGAAAMRLSSGAIVTSVAPTALNPAVELCHETGAFCEAHKRDEAVVASVCVTRPAGRHNFWILSPCGVCQERLLVDGPHVAVGVPAPHDPTEWASVRLRDVQPHWWGQVFPEEGYAWPDET